MFCRFFFQFCFCDTVSSEKKKKNDKEIERGRRRKSFVFENKKERYKFFVLCFLGSLGLFSGSRGRGGLVPVLVRGDGARKSEEDTSNAAVEVEDALGDVAHDGEDDESVADVLCDVEDRGLAVGGVGRLGRIERDDSDDVKNDLAQEAPELRDLGVVGADLGVDRDEAVLAEVGGVVSDDVAHIAE